MLLLWLSSNFFFCYVDTIITFCIVSTILSWSYQAGKYNDNREKDDHIRYLCIAPKSFNGIARLNVYGEYEYHWAEMMYPIDSRLLLQFSLYCGTLGSLPFRVIRGISFSLYLNEFGWFAFRSHSKICRSFSHSMYLHKTYPKIECMDGVCVCDIKRVKCH